MRAPVMVNLKHSTAELGTVEAVGAFMKYMRRSSAVKFQA